MEYFTYKNRIAAIDNGEEIGEVTFAPQGDYIYAAASRKSKRACSSLDFRCSRGPQHPERDGVYVIHHTYVDDRYRGQGIASELVRRAVEEIERRGGRVEATCSYALLWLARNRGCEITSPLSCPI